MIITSSASQHLLRLMERLDGTAIGLRFDGSVGTCRGSVPLLKPVTKKPGGYLEVAVGEILFFIPEEYKEVFAIATLDYETGLFSRGLNLKWPHREGGCPNCNYH